MPSDDPFSVTTPVTAPTGSSATPRALRTCLALGLLAAVVLPPTATGIAWSLVALLILVAAWRARTIEGTRADLVLAVLAGLLVTVPAYRSAPWLAVLCLPMAAGLASLSLVPARTWTGTLLASISGLLMALPAVRWLWPTLSRTRPSTRRAAVVGVSCVLTTVFGGLFLAADSAYAAVVENAVPLPDLTTLPGRVFVMIAVTIGASVAIYLAQRAPALDDLAPGSAKPVRAWEWAAPLVCVDLLFMSFVLVQLTVLFGGRRHVLMTEGLTYAQYARHGFWQLLVVTGLTLAVIAAVARYAPRRTTQERNAVRLLLGILCVLSLVIVASALKRMSVYQDEYGFTRLRIFVDAVEFALGVMFVLVLASGVRLRASWLPRAAVMAGAVALLALAGINPDAYVARHNVARLAATGQVDIAYLAELSADAVPELLRLPPAARACALAGLRTELSDNPDPWYNTNVARTHARDLLRGMQLVCGAP
jgi:hypothetical protein